MCSWLQFLILISLFVVVFVGCHSPRLLSKEDLERKDRDVRLVSIQLKNGTLLDFSSDPAGFAILRGSVIMRDRREGMEIIPLSDVDVSTAYRESRGWEDAGNILILTCGAIVVVYLLLGTIRFPGL